MRASLLFLAAGLASATQAHSPLKRASLQSAFSKRVPTPDNTCGNVGGGANKGYTCDPNLELGGPCCSQAGYCGSTEAYCGSGCQPDFGTCTDPDQPSDPDPPSTEGRCGADGAGQSCPSGQCCSAAGYCGTDEEYCSDPDCQWRFGKCDSNATPSGTTTLNDARPLRGSVSYNDDIYDCVKNNVVALTYDDGPYSYTAELLDILKRYGFRATFFITGNNLGKGPVDTTAPYPSIIKRMINEGHQVASHTWSHYNLSDLPSDVRMQQMVKNERALANIIGYYPTYMRPPFSECSQASGCPADLKKLGYHRIYFDLDTQDYLNPLPSQIQKSKDIVRRELRQPGVTDYLSIQHDIQEQSVRNLSSYYFDQIKAKGWKGVTVGECLNDPKTNWYRVPGTASPILRSSITELKKSSSKSVIKTSSQKLTAIRSSKIPTKTSKTASNAFLNQMPMAVTNQVVTSTSTYKITLTVPTVSRKT